MGTTGPKLITVVIVTADFITFNGITLPWFSDIVINRLSRAIQEDTVG